MPSVSRPQSSLDSDGARYLSADARRTPLLRRASVVLAASALIVYLSCWSRHSAAQNVWIHAGATRGEALDAPPGSGGRPTEWLLRPGARNPLGWPVRYLVQRPSATWAERASDWFARPFDGVPPVAVVAISTEDARTDGWQRFVVHTRFALDEPDVHSPFVGAWYLTSASPSATPSHWITLQADGTMTYFGSAVGLWISSGNELLFGYDEGNGAWLTGGASISGDPPVMRTGHGWIGTRDGPADSDH